MMQENTVATYGWTDGDALQSQDYLARPIQETLVRLGAHKVLDLGCGNGAMANWLQGQGFDVCGCDQDEAGIRMATAHSKGARFQRIGVYDDPDGLSERNFDAVYSTEVIEHLFQPHRLPLFAHRALKPGGYLIISTPYHGYLKNLLIALFDKWDSHHTPLWDGGHIKFWSRRTLTTLLEANGFQVTGFMGAGRVYGLWKSMIIVARAIDR